MAVFSPSYKLRHHVLLCAGILIITPLLGGVIASVWPMFHAEFAEGRDKQRALRSDYQHESVEEYLHRLHLGRVIGGIAGVALCFYISLPKRIAEGPDQKLFEQKTRFPREEQNPFGEPRDGG